MQDDQHAEQETLRGPERSQKLEELYGAGYSLLILGKPGDSAECFVCSP
jgi:hypothetical protein